MIFYIKNYCDAFSFTFIIAVMYEFGLQFKYFRRIVIFI